VFLPGEWAALLDGIVVAPNRLLQAAARRRAGAAGVPCLLPEAGDVVSQLAGLSESGDRRRTIGRLVAGLWLGHDPLFDPKHTLTTLVAAEYRNLIAKTPADCTPFTDRARGVNRIAEEWKEKL
jgi:hypothetical protein